MVENNNQSTKFIPENYKTNLSEIYRYYWELLDKEKNLNLSFKHNFYLYTSIGEKYNSFNASPLEIKVANGYSADSRVYDMLKHNGFIDSTTNKFNPVEYIPNRYGFRGPNFDSKEKSILCLGCSDTFGVGQYLENTWPHMLSEKLGRVYWNLGIPGGDYSSFYKAFKIMINEVNIDTVFLLGTYPYRKNILYYDESKYITKTFISYTDSDLYSEDKEKNTFVNTYIEKALLIPEQATYEVNVHIDAIENVCRKNNINFVLQYHPCWPDNTGKIQYLINSKTRKSYAADMSHLGVDFQNLIVDRFLNTHRND